MRVGTDARINLVQRKVEDMAEDHNRDFPGLYKELVNKARTRATFLIKFQQQLIFPRNQWRPALSEGRGKSRTAEVCFSRGGRPELER